MEPPISIGARQQYLDRKYRRKVWFVAKPTDHTTLFQACWCNSCMNGHYSTNLLKLYSYKGITIADGQIITPNLLKQVSETFYKHFHRCPTIPSLEDLSGQAVSHLIKRRQIDLTSLPLLMQSNMEKNIYNENTAEYRRYFTFIYLTLPQLLSTHIGKYIVIGNTHPNKFKEEARIREADK